MHGLKPVLRKITSFFEPSGRILARLKPVYNSQYIPTLYNVRLIFSYTPTYSGVTQDLPTSGTPINP